MCLDLFRASVSFSCICVSVVLRRREFGFGSLWRSQASAWLEVLRQLAFASANFAAGLRVKQLGQEPTGVSAVHVRHTAGQLSKSRQSDRLRRRSWP